MIYQGEDGQTAHIDVTEADPDKSFKIVPQVLGQALQFEGWTLFSHTPATSATSQKFDGTSPIEYEESSVYKAASRERYATDLNGDVRVVYGEIPKGDSVYVPTGNGSTYWLYDQSGNVREVEASELPQAMQDKANGYKVT